MYSSRQGHGVRFQPLLGPRAHLFDVTCSVLDLRVSVYSHARHFNFGVGLFDAFSRGQLVTIVSRCTIFFWHVNSFRLNVNGSVAHFRGLGVHFAGRHGCNGIEVGRVGRVIGFSRVVRPSFGSGGFNVQFRQRRDR